MSKAKVLVVEDDPALLEVIAYNLQLTGFHVVTAKDGHEALRQSRLQSPDLVLLDIMLPGIDGHDVCRGIRADSNTRDQLIIMMSARAEESDQLVGFTLGADDYVTKPFSIKVLLERVKALLRRVDGGADRNVAVSQGVMIDRERHRATAGDEKLDLTPTEFALLETMLRQPGRVFSRLDLIDVALGGESMVLERTIDVHIRALRKKLKNHAALIETVRGVGYRFRDPRG
ncbi:MAG: response regulator [Planctomycetales bacterium]|nr:response regulator [Planctomycetales bacterium]